MLTSGKEIVRGMSERTRWLLAIDTATDQAGIGVFDGHRLATRSWPGSRQQTTSLLPHIESLIEDVGIGLPDLGAVAVAIGPGSFTGLRVGLSVAKGLVLASGCALVGIPTLDVSAMPLVEAGIPCMAVAPAGRGRVVWAKYEPGLTATPRNSPFAEFLESASETSDALVVGEVDDLHRSRLAESGVRVPSLAAGMRQPGVLAELGWRRWQAGEVDDPILLEPAYLHGRPNPR